MSKQMKLLIALASVLVVVFVLYLVMFGKNDSRDTNTVLRSEKIEDIESVVIQNEGGVFNFKYSDGVWEYLDDEAFPVNEAFFESLEKGVTSIPAKRCVSKDGGEAAKYGLDEPGSVATVSLKDGSSFSIYVGDRNTTTGDYYISCDGAKGIYTAAETYAGRFCRTILDMASKKLVPDIDIDKVSEISVEKGEESFCEKYFEDGTEVSYSSNINWFVESDGKYYSSEDRLAKELKDAIVNISLQECVAYKPTKEELAGFGFDDPGMTLEMSYENNGEMTSAVLLIGNETGYEGDDGTNQAGSYIYFPGEQIVYVADNANIEYLLNLSLDTLRSTRVSKVKFEEMEGMEIETASESHSVSFVRSIQKDLQGDDMTVVEYEVDGRMLDDDSPWGITYSVNSMRAEGFPEEDEQLSDKPDVRVEFTRNTEKSGQVVIEYYKYDNNFYIAITNNDERFLVNRKDVETLIKQIELY